MALSSATEHATVLKLWYLTLRYFYLFCCGKKHETASLLLIQIIYKYLYLISHLYLCNIYKSAINSYFSSKVITIKKKHLINFKETLQHSNITYIIITEMPTFNILTRNNHNYLILLKKCFFCDCDTHSITKFNHK